MYPNDAWCCTPWTLKHLLANKACYFVFALHKKIIICPLFTEHLTLAINFSFLCQCHGKEVVTSFRRACMQGLLDCLPGTDDEFIRETVFSWISGIHNSSLQFLSSGRDTWSTRVIPSSTNQRDRQSPVLHTKSLLTHSIASKSPCHAPQTQNNVLTHRAPPPTAIKQAQHNTYLATPGNCVWLGGWPNPCCCSCSSAHGLPSSRSDSAAAEQTVRLLLLLWLLHTSQTAQHFRTLESAGSWSLAGKLKKLCKPDLAIHYWSLLCSYLLLSPCYLPLLVVQGTDSKVPGTHYIYDKINMLNMP